MNYAVVSEYCVSKNLDSGLKNTITFLTLICASKTLCIMHRAQSEIFDGGCHVILLEWKFNPFTPKGSPLTSKII